MVVFFCGAGVSMGPGSDLPDFADLVQHVYDAKRIEPDAGREGSVGYRGSGQGARPP